MKISGIIALLGLSMALMASCDTVDTFNWEEKYYGTPDQVYNKTFNNVFTKVGDSIRWTTVEAATVRVTPLTPDESVGVQLFTAEPYGSRSDCFMLYEGTIATGESSALTFDNPMGLEYVYVGLVQSDGARVVFPLSVGSARSIRIKPAQSYSAAGISLLTPSSPSGYYPFASKYYSHSNDTYYEFRNNFNRSNGLCTSFEYMSLGNDIYIIPFGNSDEKDRTLYCYVYNPAGTTLETVKESVTNGTISGTRIYASGDAVVSAVSSTTEPYRTKPYILRGVPSGYHVLFYTVSTSGRILTSNATCNSDNLPAGGIMEVNGHTIVRFDETGSNASVNGTRTNGYDDLAFGLYGGVVTDFENSAASYTEYGVTYAFEAPLTTAETDMDFNDAIVRVQHVCGRNSLHIIPVAVGEKGCEIDVAFQNAVRQPELHTLLGADTSVTVNTASITVKTFDTTTVEVSSDYLISNNQQDIQFNLRVGSTDQRSYKLPAEPASLTNVFVIGSPRWNWSVEGSRIDTPYPYVIRWAAVPSGYSAWYGSTWTSLNSHTKAHSFLAGDSQTE